MREQFKSIQLGCLAIAVCLGLTAVSQAEEVTRFVDFRDGTCLQMTFLDDTLPWQQFSAEGGSDSTSLSLLDIEELQLVYVSPGRKLELVREALDELKSDDYLEREEAQLELIRLGGQYLDVLENALERGQEVDFLWRLSAVLEDISGVQAERNQGDAYFDAEGNRVEGDVANWAPKASAFGTTLTLDRRTISSIGRDTDENAMLSGPTVGLVRQIEAGEGEPRFSGIMHIDFETGPEGSPLKGTEDVSELYVPWGCLLETSYPDSRVVLESGFQVQGKSGGFCATNDSPKYRGIMTIRFCQPNLIDSPASVRLVGLWVADVKPGGTTLEAYDATGRLLTSITTTRRGSEFLAIESAVPIAYLQIVPNENRDDPSSYDPNYAIDDLMFESPQALSQESGLYTIVLRDGQVLRGSELQVFDDELRLADLTVGIEELRVPLVEVRALLPTCSSESLSDTTESAFVMMEDGSVLRVVNSPEGLTFARFEGIPLPTEEIVALWGRTTNFAAAPMDWEGEEPLLMNKRQQLLLSEVTWGDTWIEAESLAPEAESGEVEAEPAEDPLHGDARNELTEDETIPNDLEPGEPLESLTYENSPMVWLRPQPQVASDQSRVRLTSGEEYVFSAAGFQLLDWNHEQIRISVSGETIEIPVSEVVLLVTDTPGS